MATPKTINDLTLEQVTSVYSGRNGKCCCGCAGRHYQAKAMGDYRGGGMPDDLRNVKRIYNLLKRTPVDKIEPGGNHFATVIGSRLYIAYFA